jgi:hypothetical protein
MKTKRHTLMIAIALIGLAGLWATPMQAAGDSARVSVILVEAGNGEGGVDGALRPYASTLQRLFRFQSYKQLSKGSIRLNVPGEGSTGLAGGQSLTLKADEGGRGLMAELTWQRGGKRLLHTRIQLRPGSPAVLGGPSTGKGGNYLLILTLD